MKSRRSRTIPAAIGRSFLWIAIAATIFAPAGGYTEAAGPESVVGEVVQTLESLTSSEKAEEAADSGTETEPAVEEQEQAEPPNIRVSPEGKVEMHVRDLDLASVLQMLSMQSQRNIVASQSVSGTVTANLYRVTFEEALTAILAGNGCAWREEGNFIFVYTNTELQEMVDATRQTFSRLIRLHYARAADVQAMIQPLLSDIGTVTMSPQTSVGIASDPEQGGGDSYAIEDCLLVVDYPENIEAIEKLVAEIDVRPRQVLVEATILRARLNEETSLGIDFDLVGGIDFTGLSASSTGIRDLATGNLPAMEFNNTTFAGMTDFRGAVPAGGFTFGLIKNNIAAFIRALEQVTDTTVLANPKILAVNKQRGEVIVGQRDGYLTTTVTETAAVQSVEFLETGTQLIFRPIIGDDGYVRMEIHPEDSTGGITAANLPSEQTTEITTNVYVRDGNTILIGGLFREVTTASRGQLPLIGNVPIAGALFRNSRDSTQREEVIILLTVHIIKDDEAITEASIEAVQDVERYRVGMRQALQWFGRERLAQAHYHWALEHLANGHMSRALWDLDLALNNSPKLLAAAKAKEELLDKRAWEEDSSSIRGFLSRLIMKEQGLIRPDFDRPEPQSEFPAIHGPSGFEDGGDDQQQASAVPQGTSRTAATDNSGKGDS